MEFKGDRRYGITPREVGEVVRKYEDLKLSKKHDQIFDLLKSLENTCNGDLFEATVKVIDALYGKYYKDEKDVEDVIG